MQRRRPAADDDRLTCSHGLPEGRFKLRDMGVGVRWRSPLGPVRVDFAVPVKTELEKSWRVHVLLGPDI